jgi:hypothetical protein
MAIRTVGEAGGTPEIAATVTQDCIEMNPDALALGRAHFGLSPGPRLRLFLEPAEQLLARLPPLRYDAVMLDVSQPPDEVAAPASPRNPGLDRPERDSPERDRPEMDPIADRHAVPLASWRTAAAAASLRRLLRHGGLLQINTLGLSPASRVRYTATLRSIFGGERAVLEAHCEEGNVVFAACRGGELRRPTAQRL